MKRVTQQYQRWMRLIIVTGLFVAGALDLHAQTNIWTNTASGFWTNTVGYWSLPHAPTNTDVIDYITNALSKTVTIDANTPVGNLTISNLTIKGCSGATNTLYLSGNTTPFTVLGPTVLDSADASSLGALVINGGLAAVTNGTAPQMTVGYTYVGSLTVSNSGVLVVNGMKLSSSSAGAQGTLTIFGGTVTNLGALYVGNNANATGNVMLISGTLMSTNGSSHTDYIGQGTGSSANMTISNGLFESYAPLFGYGANSRCTLTIAGGTNIFCTPYLGYLNGSIGTIVMTNGQMEVTNFNSGSSCIKIGGNASTGVGNLIVSNGTLYVSVINGSSSSVGNSSNAQGTVTIAGGNSIFGQALTCGNGTNSSGTILEHFHK